MVSDGRWPLKQAAKLLRDGAAKEEKDFVLDA